MTTEQTPSSVSSPLRASDKSVLDASGDLHLHIGPEKHVALVCSKALRRASVVFEVMLSRRFKEAKPSDPGGEWVVALPEDCKDPLLTVLFIIHGRYEFVRIDITALELYQILVVTDKYDMTEITRPWARQWVDHVQRTTQPILAWIAWELGEATIFEYAVDKLAMTCSLDEKGRLVSEKGEVLSNAKYDPLRPSDILAHVATIRTRVLDDMIYPLRVLYEDLKESKSECCEGCAMTNLGSLLISASRCGLDPFPMAANEYSGSVVDLKARYSKLKVMSPHYGPNVINPLPAIMSLVKMAIESRRHDVPEIYLKHMENQRKKSGILCTKGG